MAAVNLKDDPKVAALVEKEVSKAVKAETKRVLDLIKSHGVLNKETEDKGVRNAVATVLKGLAVEIKAAA